MNRGREYKVSCKLDIPSDCNNAAASIMVHQLLSLLIFALTCVPVSGLPVSGLLLLAHADPLAAREDPGNRTLPDWARRLSISVSGSRRHQRSQKRRRMTLGSACTESTGPPCGTGLRCECGSGRRLFGAPAATCTCKTAPSPPPSMPPPSSPPIEYNYASSQCVVSTLAGSGANAFQEGIGTSASFSVPHGIAVTPDAASLIIGDSSNNRVRLINLGALQTSTLAGSDPSHAFSRLLTPSHKLRQVRCKRPLWPALGAQRTRRALAPRPPSTSPRA